MQASKIIIRPGTLDDADNIHAALLGIAYVLGDIRKIESTPDDIRKFGFGQQPAFETLIAEIDGAFAGLCLFFPSFSTWRGQLGVYVQDLYVPEKWRGLGIGEKLLRRLAALTRKHGGGYIRLTVDMSNRKAQAFYERVGVRRLGDDQIHAAYRQDFDALADAGDEELS